MSRKPLRVHFKTKLTERQSVRFVCCYRTTRTILAGKRWQATGGDGPASTACWDSSGMRSNASSRRYRICQSVVLPPAELRLPRVAPARDGAHPRARRAQLQIRPRAYIGYHIYARARAARTEPCSDLRIPATVYSGYLNVVECNLV